MFSFLQSSQLILCILIAYLLSACATVKTRPEFYIPIGHSEPAISVDVSADGRYAASGSNDFSIKLWDLSTGREIRTLHTGRTLITAVAFSPDGRLLRSGHTDGTTRLWELSTGKMIRKLGLHIPLIVSPFHGGSNPSLIHAVGFTDDGKMAISSGRDGYIKVVAVANSLNKVKYRTSASSHAFGSAISANGRYAMLTAWKLDAWDVMKRKKIAEIDIHQNYTRKAITGAISSDGNTAVTNFRNGLIEIWDLKRSRQIRKVSLTSNMVRTIVFSNNSKHFLCIHYNGDVSLWTSRDGKKVKEIKLGSRKAYSGVFVSGDRRVLLGNEDGSLDLYNISSGTKIRSIRRYALETTSVEMSPENGVMVTGTETGEVHMWDIVEGRNVSRFRGNESPIMAIAFSKDGSSVISGQKNGFLNIWNTRSGKSVYRFQAHSSPVHSLTLTQDQQMILSAGADKHLKLWDLSSGSEIIALAGHKHWISDVAVTSDSKFALTSSYDGTVRFWDLHLKKLIREVPIGVGWVQSISISPDGNFAVAGCFRKIVLIDMQSGVITKEIELHDGYVMDVALSPDGKYIYTAGEDYLIKKWHIRNRSLVKTFKGHTNVISSIAISSDGQKIVTCSRDLTTRIWDAEKGDEIARLLVSVDGEWIITTPDGYYNTSPEGTTLVRWAFPGSQETFSFEQFESNFHRPNFIRQRLSGDQMAGQSVPEITRPPMIHMPDHQSIKTVGTSSYKLNLKVLSSDTVKTVRIFNNGKALLEVPVNEKEKSLSLAIQLFSGANRITAVAHDEKGFSSNPKYADIICQDASLPKPNLYILGIGVSDYSNLSAKWQLDFAHTDAKSLIKAFQNQGGKLFDEVNSNYLANQDASVENITSALGALSAIDNNDVAVIFMAGHGVKGKDETFYFLTSNGSIEYPKNGGLSWALLGDYLSKIKGRVILFLDACHSGSIVNETIIPNDALAQQFFAGKRGGIMVFSASKGRQFSMENPDFGGGFGIFTYALTQGMMPMAAEVDISGNGYVEFLELVEYVSKYVDSTTNGEQTPWLSRKELFGDFPLAVVE